METPKKIIIIEDEKTLARALEFKLKRLGFEVKVAFNGADGMTLLEKESFDIILLDLIMPTMDGFTVLANLRGKRIKTPVVVLTNLSQENDIERTKKFGVREFFIKSNTPIATIAGRVAELLE